MSPLELRFITACEAHNKQEQHKVFNEAITRPIGKCTKGFLEHPLTQQYMQELNQHDSMLIMLHLYSLKKNANILQALREWLIEIVADHRKQLELYRTPETFFTAHLICAVYNSNQGELIKLFSDFLPPPKTIHFKNPHLPFYLEKTSEIIHTYLSSHEHEMTYNKANMKSISEKLLKLEHDFLTVFPEKNMGKLYDILQNLKNAPLGTCTLEFLQHPWLKIYIREQTELRNDYILWYLLNLYMRTNDQNVLNDLREWVHEELENYKKASLEQLQPDHLFAPHVIRSIYLSHNPSLVSLFSELMPPAKIALFKDEIPEIVVREQQKADQTIGLFQAKQNSASLTKATKMIQRKYRGSKRQKEEQKRIARNYADYLATNAMTAKDLIDDANRPYTPQCCDTTLAERIFRIAARIQLFDTVAHITSPSTISEVFDSSLFGRHTLKQLYLTYVPAALKTFDVINGDGNVICFGPQKIDQRNKNIIQIVFDVKKLLAQNNPTIFFKQKDLGFQLNQKREIYFPDKATSPIVINHTARKSEEILLTEDMHFSYITISYKNLNSVFKIPNALLISYNTAEMHQILILNFFRFLDILGTSSQQDDVKLSQEIYAQISKLNDDELFQFLLTVGQNISDTSEFNFYGAHEIDFSTIRTISAYQDLISETKPEYTCDIANLILELEKGSIDALLEAKTNLPEVFASKRFVEFLLSQVSHEKSRGVLLELKKAVAEPKSLSKLTLFNENTAQDSKNNMQSAMNAPNVKRK